MDAAWRQLSDTAEDLLVERGATGMRRSADWRALPCVHPRSRRAASFETLAVVQLRRLWRRLLQLGRFPSDARLRDKAARQIEALVAQLPWLREIPYFWLAGGSDDGV